MKRFFLLLGLGVVLFGIFLLYLTSEDNLSRPLGAKLIPLVTIGAGGLLAFWGVYLHASEALSDLIMFCRRRQWHKELRRQPKKSAVMGITTALL